MSLGQPKTKKFNIGTAELRVGALSSANKLTQAHSVGLVDTVTVNVTQESVDLQGGFPKTVVDTAIISQTAEVTGTLREYSRRNMQILLGAGVSSTEPTDITTSVAVIASAGAVSLSVPEGEGLAGAVPVITKGMFLVIYPDGNPENVSVVLVDADATNNVGVADVIALDADTPLLHDVKVGDLVFVAHQVAIGDITRTNYFSVQVLQRENSSGRPVMFNFWKASISTGLEYSTNADDFSSTDLAIKILQPTACEYASGGALEHLANIIPTNPTGMFIGGADDGAC